MNSHLTKRGTVTVKLTSGGPVRGMAFVAPQRCLHRRPHDRMKKTRRIGGGQHLDPDQPSRQLDGRINIQPRHGSGMADLTAISQYRKRPGQAERARIQPPDPRLDVPGYHITYRAGRPIRISEAHRQVPGLSAQQLMEIERVPPLASSNAWHRASGVSAPIAARTSAATPPGLSSAGRIVRAIDLTVSRAPSRLTGSSRPQRRHHSDFGSLQPAHKIGQPPKRRGVRPVSVVHHDQHPLMGGHVHGQPVQAVHQGEQPVMCAAGAVLPGQQPTHRASRAGQQPGAVQRIRRGQLALEQLTNHPEGKARLQLGATGTQHPPAPPPRALATLLYQRGLAYPGAAFDNHGATILE